MNGSHAKTLITLVIGFVAGITAANFPSAIASSDMPVSDLSKRKFQVSVDEITQNFVFGEGFAGSYSRTFTLSDGSKRTIQLTPMVHDGMQVIELRDSGYLSYMALNGVAENGRLMVQTRDPEAFHRELKEQGWFRK